MDCLKEAVGKDFTLLEFVNQNLSGDKQLQLVSAKAVQDMISSAKENLLCHFPAERPLIKEWLFQSILVAQ